MPETRQRNHRQPHTQVATGHGEWHLYLRTVHNIVANSLRGKAVLTKENP